MASIEKRRLALAVYLFLGLLCILLVVIPLAYIDKSNPIKDVLLNLASEIAGVVLIFFIVNRLFLIDREDELSKKIDLLQNSVETKFSPLVWKSKANEHFDFDTLIYSAETISLLGYNLAQLLGDRRAQLAEAVSRGLNLRIMIIDPDGEAAKFFFSSLDSDMLSRDAQRSLRYFNDIKKVEYQSGKPKGLFNVKLISWVPSCGMNIVQFNKDDGIARISLHSPSIRMPVGKIRENLELIFKKQEHNREFEYFLTLYNILWEDKYSKFWSSDVCTSDGRARQQRC